MDDRSTMAQVAAAAGVSLSTVSRVLTGRGEIAAATRARVLDAARRLGYSRAEQARGRPRRGVARPFDLVLGQFHDPWSDEVTAGARVAAFETGHDLVLTAERDTPDDDWPMRIRDRGSSGVVLGLILPTASQLSVLEGTGIPLVLLDPRADESLPLASVRTSDREGGAEAGRHLVIQGARRFIAVSGAPTYRFGRARVDGFAEAIRELLPDAHIDRVSADWTAPGSRAAVASPLTRAVSTAQAAGEGPVGVFACSDEMAAGVYAAAADGGLRIPGDLMVVGFDDVRGARWLSPALTTVRQPIREMAAEAVRLLAGLARGESSALQRIVLPTELVVRASTGIGS